MGQIRECPPRVTNVQDSGTEYSHEKERRFLSSFPSAGGSGASSETQGEIVGARERPHYLSLGLRGCFCACVPRFSWAPPITHVRYIKILTWLRGFSLCSILFGELRDNGVEKNLHFDPKASESCYNFNISDVGYKPQPQVARQLFGNFCYCGATFVF